MKRHLFQLVKLLVFGAISLVLIFNAMHDVIQLIVVSLFLYALFFFFFFKKEMGTNPQEWFQSEDERLPSLSEEKQLIYEASGLSDSDIQFFREKMKLTKERIERLEELITSQGKLQGIATRYQVVPVMKDYFQELVKQPQRLHEADKFLNTYIPSLMEVSSRYEEINRHKTKTAQTYQMLSETAELFEGVCQQIEAAYVAFQEDDFEQVEVEGMHMKHQAEMDTFEDF